MTSERDLQRRLEREAADEVERLIEALPAVVAGKARSVVTTIEPTPSEELAADGLEPDLLGLFVGRDLRAGVEDTDVMPPQIFLFVTNLWQEAGRDWEEYRVEVRRTYLHELGHYLGLDEEDLFERDLE